MIGGGAIVGIIGPEGSGKTSLMTSFCMAHVSDGGKLLTFPGYEVHDESGKTLSTPILPEEWVTIPKTLKDVLIAITEADSFFDSLETGAATAKLFRGVAKQRRKRSMSIIYDVNDWSWFNNRLRKLTHILYKCWDLFWTYRNKPECPPKGTTIAVTPYDVQGFYTGRPWCKGRPFKFNAADFWPNFDTEETVDAYEAMVRVKIKRREINVVDGKVVSGMPNEDIPVDMEAIEGLAQKYNPNNGVEVALKKIVDGFRKAGIEAVPAEEMREFVESQGISLHPQTLGKILNRLGAPYKRGWYGHPHLYRILDVA